MGFSRQGHWGGLPFPSPIHESEKWKWSRSVVSDSSRPHGLWPTRLLRPWDSPGTSTGVGCHFLLQGSSRPRDRTWVSRIAGRRFTVWATREVRFPRWYGIYTYACVYVLNHWVTSDSLWPHGLQSVTVPCPWDFPDKNTEVGCHFFFQGIFPTQGLNLSLLHCRQILYHYAI